MKQLAIGFLIFSMVSVQTMGASPDNSIDVSISNGPNGSHFIDGHFMVQAPINIAWDTLTDYDGLSSFVSTIQVSQRLSEKDGNAMVKQVMTGKVGFFRKKISLLLDINEAK